jgi:rhodanese-related sulfurtransferase
VKLRALASIAAALASGVLGAAWAQVLPDETCPRHAVTVAAFAACDGDRAAHPTLPATLTAEQLLALKSEAPHRITSIDVRLRSESARGIPSGIDVAVPYRADTAEGQPGGRSPHFIGMVDEAIHRLGATRTAPIALIGHDGDLQRAADELREAGFWNVATVAGGIDKSIAADGSVVAGWRALHLPWQVPEAQNVLARLD